VAFDGESNALANQLICLASDEVDDDRHQRPLDFIVSLWRENPAQCEQAILQSVSAWAEFPLIADDVQIASEELGDVKYADVLEACTKSAFIPSDVKLRFLMLLAKQGRSDGLDRWKNNFRRTVAGICGGKVDATKISILEHVREICLLHLTDMREPLQQLSRLFDANVGRKYYFDLLTKCQIDAALLWIDRGPDTVAACIAERKTKDEMRAGCIFCLGCECSERYMTDFVQCYEEYRGRRFGIFDVESACVEAIVYSGSAEQVRAFLASALGTKLSGKTLRKAGFDAGLGLLLRAAYYATKMDSGLKEGVEMCLQAKNSSVAALAWLVLRKHGVQIGGYEEKQEEAIELERQHLCDHPSLMMAMGSRSG
jgi:hypothetical protein